jgi:ATP/maltotriose-dependent transcriptional regulator MalT
LTRRGASIDRFRAGVLNELAQGKAFYRQAEIHRLRGDFGAALDAYREAGRLGCEPQPGLALLRIAQGNADAAVGAIRRAVSEVSAPLERVALLPAYIEIMLAVDASEEAESACRELEQIAQQQGSEVLAVMSAQARGSVALAAGEPAEALIAARRACAEWREIDAPYEVARCRVLIGLACRLLDDDDSGELELEAARRTFAELGARTEVDRVDSLVGKKTDLHGLTARELEVLRLVAAGKSNQARCVVPGCRDCVRVPARSGLIRPSGTKQPRRAATKWA